MEKLFEEFDRRLHIIRSNLVGIKVDDAPDENGLDSSVYFRKLLGHNTCIKVYDRLNCREISLYGLRAYQELTTKVAREIDGIKKGDFCYRINPIQYAGLLDCNGTIYPFSVSPMVIGTQLSVLEGIAPDLANKVWSGLSQLEVMYERRHPYGRGIGFGNINVMVDGSEVVVTDVRNHIKR